VISTTVLGFALAIAVGAILSGDHMMFIHVGYLTFIGAIAWFLE
jgi:hypothetical protein